jgi:hypothetical protein
VARLLPERQAIGMQPANGRRGAVLAELRALINRYEIDAERRSIAAAHEGSGARWFIGDEDSALVAAARPDQSHDGSDVRRLRWWVFLSVAAETRLGLHELLGLTWSDLNSSAVSRAFRDEVLTFERLALLHRSTWREATTFARGVDRHPFPWSSSVARRKLNALRRSMSH